MGDKQTAPKAPSGDDVSKDAQKATKQAKKQVKGNNRLQREQFAFFKDAYNENKELIGGVTDKQLEILDQNSEWAAADRERFTTVFQPLEDDLVREAMDYASQGRMDLETGRAQADVANKYEQQRESSLRALEGYGINPGATRFAALDANIRNQKAAAQAAAAEQARMNVENTRRALRTEAIGVGQKYPGFADQASDTAIAAGNAASSNVLENTKVAGQTMGTAPQYGALANDALGTQMTGAIGQGNLQNQAYQNELAAFNAEQEANTSWAEAGGMLLGAGAKVASGGTFNFGVPKAATGGAIPGPQEPVASPGGQVPMAASPSGGAQVDDVNARLTPGEFVLPVDVVKWKGEEFFQKMIDSARKKREGASAKPEPGAALPGPATFASQPSAIPRR
jgi:hypothetical protein